MAYPDIWAPESVAQLCARIESIDSSNAPLWGKMNAAQMMAHCCIPYEQALGINTKKPPLIMRALLRLFFKQTLTNEVPYKKNLATAPEFIMPPDSVFVDNQQRLMQRIHELAALGRNAFEGREQITLGALSSREWNNLLYKHIDHHLRQFGA